MLLTLADPQVVADPYPFYAKLRREGPIVWTPDLFDGAWLVTRFAQVKELFADHEHLTSARSRGLVDTLPVEQRQEFATLIDCHRRWMVFTDPPDHSRLRGEMNRGFMARMRAGLAQRVRAHVDALIDGFVERGRVDIVSELARPLPLSVVGSLLGIDEADHPRFVGWTSDIAAYVGLERANLEVMRTAQQAILAMQSYFGAVFEDRRHSPRGGDMIAELLQNGVLEDHEITAQCAQLAFAGNETTRNLITNTIDCLLRSPDVSALVRRDPARIADAVDETLRYESPVQFIGRVVAKDFEHSGARLRRGDSVMLMIGSANRDPEANERPDHYELDRTNRKLISFGYGVHGCIGAALARHEAQVAVARFFERCSEPRLAREPQWQNNPGLRGRTALDIEFRPAAPLTPGPTARA